jgi:hypothetical protein
MQDNFAAWMIGGGPRLELPSVDRDRQNLLAFRESRRVAATDRVGLIDRLRALARTERPEADLTCCPA